MTSPFSGGMSPQVGPSITPATMKAKGQGGEQQPAYLQKRKFNSPNGAASSPVITPKPMAPGDTVNPKPVATTAMSMQPGASTGAQAGPQISPPGGAGPGAMPPQAGGHDLGGLYDFFASDLANKTKQAKSGAVADASARGVYYGTPLTGSEADIDTQYLRGMGQLQAGMYGNEQQSQLARLGMATNLSAQGALNAPPTPQAPDYSGLGALFGGTTPQDTRQGPVISPPSGQPGGIYGPSPSQPNVKEALKNPAPPIQRKTF